MSFYHLDLWVKFIILPSVSYFLLSANSATIVIDINLYNMHVRNFQEIDYTKEAANAELFASNFKDMDYVKVPSIYWEYTTPQV